MKKFLALFSLLALAAPFTAVPAAACAACFNANAGSKMGDAANWGIIARTVIMFIVLGALFGIGCYFNWRAKHPLPDYSELLADEEETHASPDALPDAS